MTTLPKVSQGKLLNVSRISDNFTSCGGLNTYGLLRLMRLKVRPIGGGSIRRCGLVGGNVSLWGGLWDLLCSSYNYSEIDQFLLPVSRDVELFQHHVCLQATMSYYVYNGLNL